MYGMALLGFAPHLMKASTHVVTGLGLEIGFDGMALSRISPRVRVRVNVSIVSGLATIGYSWI